MLFTSNTMETNFHPNVRINGTLIPLEKKVKFLGLNLTTMYKATSHIDILAGKMKKGHQLLKALRGQDWGNKETLRQTYQPYIKLTFIRGAPAWNPNINPEASSNRTPAKNPELHHVADYRCSANGLSGTSPR
jgi:hypothetical protein